MIFSNSTQKSFGEIVQADSVNLELISEILTSQNIEHEVDGETIQVIKGLAFDVFISIEDDKNLIKLRTYVKLKASVTERQLSDIASQLNRETAPLKYTATYYQEESPPHGYIDGDYYLFYQFGFTPQSFLYQLRLFSLAFSNAIKSVNKNKKISDALFQG